MAKAKQKIEINGIFYGTGSIGMKDSTFKELPANVKQGNKLSTLSQLRNCVNLGEFKGDFTIGNHYGYLFKYEDKNVLVDKDVRMIIAAYKDKIDKSIQICRPTINKSEIKPLKVVDTKLIIVNNTKTIKIGDQTIDLSTVELTDHFLKRCKERFYITDKNYARKFMEDILLNGEYLGIAKDEFEGNVDKEAHLFTKNSIGLFISLDGRRTKTVYEKDKITKSKPKELIKSLLQKKINKLQSQQTKICKRNMLSTLEINKQIAEYELLKHRAKSQSKKLAYQAYINGLQEIKQQNEAEHAQISKELNDFTKSMIAFT